MRRNHHTPSGSAVHAETPGSPDAAAGQAATSGLAEAIAAAGRSLPELACWILPAAYYPRLQDTIADRRWLRHEIARRFPDEPFVVATISRNSPAGVRGRATGPASPSRGSTEGWRRYRTGATTAWTSPICRPSC